MTRIDRNPAEAPRLDARNILRNVNVMARDAGMQIVYDKDSGRAEMRSSSGGPALKLGDMSVVMYMVMALADEASRSQMDTNSRLIDVNKQEQQKKAAEIKDNVQKMFDAEDQQREAAGRSDATGWVSSILGVVGAVLGGAAVLATGPVGLFVGGAMIFGAVMAVGQLTTQALKADGQKYTDALGREKDIDAGLNGWIDMITDDLIELGPKHGGIAVVEKVANGNTFEYKDLKTGATYTQEEVDADPLRYRTESQLSEIKMGIAMGIMAVVLAATLFGALKGLLKAKSPDQNGGALEQLQEKSAKASQAVLITHAVNVAVEFMQAGTEIARGVDGINNAEVARQATEHQLSKEQAEAQVTALRRNSEQTLKHVQALVDFMMELMSGVSEAGQMEDQAKEKLVRQHA